MFNLYDKIKEVFTKQPNKVIISTNNKNYSCREVDHYSEKLANLLYHLGISPGDRLVVQVEKSEFNLFLYLACLRCGIIYLPLNNTYTENELAYFFNDAQPKMIICDPKRKRAISTINKAKNISIETLDAFGKGSLTEKLNQITHKNHEIHSANPDETAVIIYTSGTTGKPKGAMITHQALICNAQDLVTVWNINEYDTILHVLPLFHVHGLFFALHTALLSGAKIILLPKFEPDTFFQYLSQSTLFMGVPTYYTRLLNDKRLNRKSCQAIRLFISGSAPLLPATFKDFQMRTGHTLLERYGMSETGINSSNPLNGIRKIGTVGLSLPRAKLRIVDDHNKEVISNKVGHIQIKGDNLFKGYWMNPEKTKEDFTEDGFFKTGDMGSFDTDGYLLIAGRSKDMIITGGLNVYPKEIELTIDGIDGVIESAVIGVPHPDFGEAVIAIVVADSDKIINEQVVIGIIKTQHASYKCPKKVFFINRLPKNALGKIQKNILRDRYSNLFIL